MTGRRRRRTYARSIERPAPDPGVTELAHRTATSLRRIGTLSNSVGATLVFIVLAVLDAGADVPDDQWVELVALFVAVVSGGIALAATILTRHSRPLIETLEQGAPIVGRARRVLFQVPWAYAGISSLMWVLAAIAFGLYGPLRLGMGSGAAVVLVVTIALGGLTTAATVYLLCEYRMRPVFARAFEDQEPERPPGVAVGTRLVLVWVLGSGVPLLIAGIFLLDPAGGPDTAQRDVLPWLVVAWVVGLGLSWRASRLIAAPLSDLRMAMTEVRRGRLDVRATVDDATEVGLLQAGFNNMIAGLREREHLRDLFGRHVGEDVARRALTSGVDLGGERTEASALFVDLTDSTGLAARLDPEEVVSLLNAFFGVVVDVVEEQGGWINKFQGDAALCVFGPPSGDPDHRTRALRAARHLAERLDDLTRRHPVLRAGIGVSSGDVVAGNVGSEQRFEYTVIGDPVNEAARLTDLAKETGAVLASAATVKGATADEATTWQPQPEVVLRGRSGPTRLFQPAPGGGR
jgi:adenylate cyclase